MTALAPHAVRWQAPAPLWGRFGDSVAAASTTDDQARPAILRFATDDFMDRMLGLLDEDPARIGELLARPETWRTPPGADPQPVQTVRLPLPMRLAAKARALLRPRPTIAPVPATADATEAGLPRPALPLKLFQPSQQRFYLACASFVCGIAGLPDRTPPEGAPIFFVLRRLLPPRSGGDAASAREFAYVTDGAAPRWRRVSNDADDAVLTPGEEALPAVALACQDPNGHRRTLWTGLVPASRREDYMGAGVDRTALPLTSGMLQSLVPPPAPAPPASVQTRVTEFRRVVAEPWKNLVRAAVAVAKQLQAVVASGEDPRDRRRRVYALNLQWQQASWLVLLDFADFLTAQVPNVWAAVQGGSVSLTTAEQALFDALTAAVQPAGLIAATGDPDHLDGSGQPTQLRPSWPTLTTALAAIGAARAGLEGTERLYGVLSTGDADWPPRHFLLSGLAERAAADATYDLSGPFQSLLPQPPSADVEPDPIAETRPPPFQFDQDFPDRLVDRLAVLLARALPRSTEADQPAPPFALQVARALKDTKGDPGWFVLRFVAQNPDCGPLHPPVLSSPSQRFQLAHFFDSDAPARPVRITLPLDTSAAGLRKQNRNTAFVISDMLCGQIQRAKGLGLGDLVRSVLPWPLHKDLEVGDGSACKDDGGANIGMVCSLSIPIVTICALILLIIIVILLDFFFRWLPFFFLCFPVPGLRGKQRDG